LKEEVGKAITLDCIRAMSSEGVSVGLVASISAATPEAIGAAKLVPTLAALSGLPPLLR